VSLVSSIGLPDGTSYSFTYESTQGFSGYYTGRIESVNLPTGGTISYSYPLTNSGTTNGINCGDGSAPAASGTNPSMTRTLNPGGQWTYSRTQVSGNHWQTKVSTPPDPQNPGSASDDTVIDFQKDSTTGNTPTYSFYETQRQTYQGAAGGTLLLTTIICWNGSSSNCTTTPVSSPINQKAVTVQYPNGGLQSKTAVSYSGALVTETDQYAYASGTPTTLARKSVISYASLGNGIVDHPSSVVVQDGSANVLSTTNYTYDEYSTYPLQPTNGTPQHVSITGSRGNATTVSNLVSGSTYLTRHSSYYDTGTIYQAYDVNGAVTTYNYDTTVQGNTTKSCGNSFVTGFTLPISNLSALASETWDCIGGVVTAVADLNGNITATTYNDPYFWRPASAQDPTPATTSFTYTAYNSTSQAPANVDSRMLFNSSNSVVEQLTTVGGFGQVLYSQQREGPSSTNYDSTQMLYDSFLRPYQTTMPCVTSAGQGCPSAAKTTTTFDALKRVHQTTDGGGGYVTYTYNQNDVMQAVGPAPAGENLKQRQLEYDATGRLTSVCELTSVTGYVQCGQTNSNNGYWTQYAYSVVSGYPTTTVTQNKLGSSQQTRTYTYDLLGRLLSEQNPESGTINYTYDSDSAGACSGTYSGDLVKFVDAKGNKVCYRYDSLHRVTQITYPIGPDAGNTPTKTFVYDSATYSGTAMSNAKGRLAEAYSGPSGSKATDEFFSNSVRGALTDTWQSTPHSGGTYYHITAGFWANGAPQSLSSNITGVPTQTYGVDAMGRPYSVTAGSGQNPVTSTGYDLANFKTTINYGSSDSDVVNLDPNTGRMTKYTFNVGSKSDIGQMTWNPNGSLATLAISDTVPGTSDTQTCNYTHDDLTRISSVGCVNGSTNKWNQNFTYDTFGNITKSTSGPGSSFQPTYDASKNWITALPGITTTTDNNGQVTYDGTHNYTWDAEGKMLTVDTTTLTHDALGRMVEKAVGTTYTQIVYSPLGGKFALMNGQTLVKGYVPLPGAQAVYTNTGLTYYRHSDHLGSSRLATTPSRTLYSSTAYAPYGEPYAQTGTTDLSFTGQDQDTVSGMHDFLLRKYIPVQGRWLSPDPAGLGAVDPGSPQSWNRYAYVLNNPMAMIDALGDDGCYSLEGVSDASCADYYGPGSVYAMSRGGGPSSGFGDYASQAEAAYAAFVDTVFFYNGSTISELGMGVYINWSVDSGVFLQDRNGNHVDPGIFGDRLYLGSGGSTAGGATGPPTRGGAGFAGSGAYISGLRTLFGKPACVGLLGGMTADTALHDASVEDATAPDFQMSPPQAAAYTYLINHAQGDYAATLPYGTWVLVGTAFKQLTFGQQETVLVHEIRHHALGSLGEPWTRAQYKAEYAMIVKACGTEMPK
jgi:RHS repeat-associated protein